MRVRAQDPVHLWMRYATRVHCRDQEQQQAHEQRLPLPPRTPTNVPTDAHMRALIRVWERLDVQRRKRTLVCVLTLAQVENMVSARIAQAQVRAHSAVGTTVARCKYRARQR